MHLKLQDCIKDHNNLYKGSILVAQNTKNGEMFYYLIIEDLSDFRYTLLNMKTNNIVNIKADEPNKLIDCLVKLMPELMFLEALPESSYMVVRK